MRFAISQCFVYSRKTMRASGLDMKRITKNPPQAVWRHDLLVHPYIFIQLFANKEFNDPKLRHYLLEYSKCINVFTST